MANGPPRRDVTSFRAPTVERSGRPCSFAGPSDRRVNRAMGFPRIAGATVLVLVLAVGYGVSAPGAVDKLFPSAGPAAHGAHDRLFGGAGPQAAAPASTAKAPTVPVSVAGCGTAGGSGASIRRTANQVPAPIRTRATARTIQGHRRWRRSPEGLWAPFRPRRPRPDDGSARTTPDATVPSSVAVIGEGSRARLLSGRPALRVSSARHGPWIPPTDPPRHVVP